MKIEITNEAAAIQAATVAGFASVEEFVNGLFADIAPLTQAELDASLAMCDRGMQNIANDKSKLMKEFVYQSMKYQVIVDEVGFAAASHKGPPESANQSTR